MDISKFQYIPEIDFRKISAEDSDAIEVHMEPFKRGYMKPLEAHLLNADGLRKYLGSASVTAEIRVEYRFKSRDVDDAIASIQRAFSELLMDLQDRTLETVAQRDYFNVFQAAEIEAPKMEFMIFLKTYEALKKFNMIVRASWVIIREVFEEIKIQSYNSLFLEQVLSFKVYPRLELADLTDLLLRRMALILKISKEEVRGNRLYAEGKYSSVIKYQFSTVFQKDIHHVVSEVDSGVREKKPEKVHKEFQNTCIKGTYLLDSRGSELFNQPMVYTMELEARRVQMDEKKIRVAVYVESHLGAEDLALRQELIRKFISQARKKDKVEEYNNFLYTYFDFVRDTLLLHYRDGSELEKTVFLYHFTPVYFFRLIMHFMKEGRTGYIHRHLKKDQMIRELPFEYIKFILKNWWDEKVYRKLTPMERNSRDMYAQIQNKVKTYWAEEQKRVLEKLRTEPELLRHFRLHNTKELYPFLQEELSYLYFFVIMRFLGMDFIYFSDSH